MIVHRVFPKAITAQQFTLNKYAVRRQNNVSDWTRGNASTYSKQFQGDHIPSIASTMYGQAYIQQVVTQTANVSYFRIWNADEHVTLTLTSVVIQGYDGVQLKNVRLPLNIAPRYVSSVLLSLDNIIGNVDSTITFTFTDRVVTIPFVLKQSVEWVPIPEQPWKESWQWATDVVTTFNSEQRVSLRINPRVIIDHSYTEENLKILEQEGLADKLVGKLYSIPLWSDLQEIRDIREGTRKVRKPALASHFLINASSLLLKTDETSYIHQIDSIDHDWIHFKEEIAFSSPIAYIAPIVPTYCPKGITYTLDHNEYTKYQGTFEINSLKTPAANPYETLYDGNPIVTDAPTTYETTVTANVRIEQDLLDNVSGSIAYVNNRAVKERRGVISYVCNTHEQIQRVKGWFNWLQGRRRAFWMPTFRKELELVIPLQPTMRSMTVRGKHDQYIKDGSVIYLQPKGVKARVYWFVVESASHTDGVTTLSFRNHNHPTLPKEMPDYAVARLCLAHLSRLDTDNIEYNYTQWHQMVVSAQIVSVKK